MLIETRSALKPLCLIINSLKIRGGKIMTIRNLKVFIIFVFCIFLSVSVYAAEFQPLGFEALSMGGAGVASSKGSYAAYYNPALLAVPRHKIEISI